ncbi:ATP-binding response regulator [Marinobacter alexandrii]|uniref:ATP-binding response regulator n=1 Tax=Marinobacter alexandrii TaxID=2570351 RepID=UPI00329967B8
MSNTMHNTNNPGDAIRMEQIKTLYESIASLVLINLVVGTALVYAFWDVVAPSLLLAWIAAMVAMLSVRVAVYFSFKKRFDGSKLKRYQIFLILGSASAGVIWGVGGLLMFIPGQLELQLLILLSLLAMAAGSAFSLSIYLPAYFAFVPLMLAPITLRLLLTGDTIHTALASVTIIFLIAQTAFNIKINRGLSSAMELRFENLDLIEQLKEQKAEAEQANSAKSRFLAAASHDLRQPLYALTLFVSALEEQVTSPDERKITQQIKRSANSLQSLFEALLDISKLDAGTVDIRKSDFRLKDMLARLADEFDPQAAQKGITIHWTQEPLAVNSEPALLEQILRNFIANAIRYTATGEINVTCEPYADSIKISVSDTGIGIPDEDQVAIFEEFYQLGNPERDRQKGLGLGLSIVQRAAELLDHRIEVDSQLSQGSTFSVTVDTATQSDLASAEESLHTSNVALASQPLIVVIDDEKNIREGMQQLLAAWGCEVVVSATAEGTLEKLSIYQRKPDGIISDYRLRDSHTGLDAIKAINGVYGSAIPALIVTGDTEKQLLIDLKASGHQVLYKPVPPAKLRAFLRSLPDSSAANRPTASLGH